MSKQCLFLKNIPNGGTTRMKQTAAKRILSLLIALAMMIAPLTVSVSAASGGQLKSGETVSSVREVHEFIEDPSDLIPYEPPIPFIKGLTKELAALPPFTTEESDTPSVSRSASLSAGKRVGDKQIFIDAFNSAGPYQTTIQAINAHSVIYVQDSSENFALASDFVDEISTAFENEIYSLVTGIAGAPYLAKYAPANTCDFTGEKINIVLYDINNAKNSASGIVTGGYFWNGDFLKKSHIADGIERGAPESNEAPIIYIDISSYFGAKLIEKGGFDLLGTVAHEFQHLIDHSYILKHFNALNSSDGGQSRAVWANEAMSGLVDARFLAANGYKMAADHLQPFLQNVCYEDIGYVPTDTQWSAANYYSTRENPYILLHYGSASIMMQEFVAAGGDTKNLVDTPNVGYANGLIEMGRYSGMGSFPALFEEAILNASVDSGDWESAVVNQNLWWERYNAAKDNPTGFLGVAALPNNSVPYDSEGRTYYSQLYYKNTVGLTNQYVSFTLPANAKGTYYLISAEDPTRVVRTAAQWVTAEKTAAKIVSGVEYDVGVGNGFVVLAMNTTEAVDESALSYTLIEADKPYLEVSLANDTPFVYGDAGMSVSFTATAPDATFSGKTLTVDALDAMDTVVAGITGANVTISGTTATGTVTIANTVPAGVYRLRVQDNTDPVGLLGYSPEFAVHLKLSLGQSGQTIDPTSPPNLTINVAGGAAKSGSGVFFATVDGVRYTATVKTETAATSVTIPFASFRNSGNSLLVGYGKTVAITTAEGSMVTANGATNIDTALGSITAIDEPGAPTVYPGTLNINRDTTTYANMLVYFGADTLEMETTVTSNDTAIATVDPAAVTQSGETVKVTAKERGTTTLTIGFSGSNTAGEPIQTSATVTVNVTGKPPAVIPDDPGITDPGTTDPGTTDPGTTDPGNGGGSSDGGGSSGGGSSGGSGYSSSSSSSSGGGGGGGGAGSLFTTLTSTKATKDVAKEITKAIASGSKSATVRFQNIKDISLATLKSMAAQAQKAGVTLTVNMDTVVNGKIVMRQSFDPALATKAIQFGASSTSVKAVSVAKFFKKYFSNKLEVFTLNQKEDYGMPVRTAILTSLTAENAVIYSYDTAKNQFKQLVNPKIWKDKSGYLHFDTSLANNFVLSPGKLVKK
jgi:hypothetical protein